MTDKSLSQICEDVLARAKQLGATEAEVDVSIDAGLNVTVRNRAVESIEHHQDQGIDITVYVGKKSGHASCTDLSSDSLNITLEKALNIAKFTQEDPANGLPERTRLAFDYPNLDLSHPWDITPQAAIELAVQCEEAGFASDKRITNSEGAVVTSSSHHYCYANSQGFVGEYDTTNHGMHCILIAKQGDDMQRDYEYTSARDANDLDTPEKVAEKAAKKTAERLGARSLKSTKVPVVFHRELAKGLLGNFIRAISGGALYRKSSFLLDHLGQQIFPEFVNIYQRPHLLKAPGSSPFDHDGVQTCDLDYVKSGVLESYVLGTYSARRLGMETTGNAGGVFNLLTDTSDLDFDALLKKMHKGLLVTELMGQGVNMVTGDYSRGAFGYWVENGIVQHPVQGITIAGNMKDMLKGIVAIGQDVDKRGNIQTGSILIDEMMIAGE